MSNDKNNQAKIDRCKELYLKSKKNNNNKGGEENNKMNHKEIVEEKECTFRPHLSPYSNKIKTSNLSVEKRVMEWKEKKDEKIRKIIDDKMIEKDKECLFIPQLETLKHNEYITEMYPNQESINKFLDKKAKAEIQKNEMKTKLEKIPGSGNIWSGKKTIPLEYKFSYIRDRNNKMKKNRNAHALERLLLI